MMTRRDALKTATAAAGAALLASSYGAKAASKSGNIKIPEGRKIRVAFTLGPNTQVIDLTGPWEVFQDVYINNESAFELYTVGANSDIVTMTGGMLVKPNYTVENAPQPDIILAPAHDIVPEITEWIKRTSKRATLTTSVCVGVDQLAVAGLLDGLEATTIHGAIPHFEEKYPETIWKRGMRYVDQGNVITSGGLTAGIDMSLHIVRRYFGEDVAQHTADVMEYESAGWMQSKASKVW